MGLLWMEKVATSNILKQLKEEAISLVLEQDYTAPKAAESLCSYPNTLCKWKMEEQKAHSSIDMSECDELKWLRKENKDLHVVK